MSGYYVEDTRGADTWREGPFGTFGEAKARAWAIRDGLTRADRRDRSIAVGTLTDEDILDPIIDVMEED